MTDDYKQQISKRIKKSINGWIDKQKLEQPELLLTKQWKILWPKGFKAGHITIPVVANNIITQNHAGSCGGEGGGIAIRIMPVRLLLRILFPIIRLAAYATASAISGVGFS